jgi:uncharacterized protein (TIGR02231 family)
MKITLALLGSVLAIGAVTAGAAPLVADSSITAVTVYADRAVITRSASLNVTATGTIEVAFERLPSPLLDQSVQVTGKGAAHSSLLDVATRPVFVDASANERVKAVEDQLSAVNQQDRTLADRSGVLAQQREYVLKIQTATTSPAKDPVSSFSTEESWLKLLSFSEGQLTKLAAEQHTIDSQREDLQARRAALEQQLNELRGNGSRSYKTVTVRLVATTGGRLDLTLRYTVPGPSWTPAYDARVLSSQHSVDLGYFGLVRQGTGEDWKNVELTLSTARPSLGGAAPVLNPWIVQQREIRPLPAPTAAFEGRAQKARVLELTAARTSDAEPVESRYVEAQLENQATSASFKIQTPSSIPTDNAPQRVPIATAQLATAPEYTTTPKQIAAAFLTAKVTNTSDFPLLAGSMNVFLDDTFVASSSLPTVMPSEKFDLALGADEGISVKRKLNNRFTEDTGVVSKSKRITYDYTITLQNNKKNAEKITVLDQVPLSRHEKIVVKVLAPSEREVKPDADGILKWTLSLHPGEKRELPLKFSIEYPADFPVSGLD